MHIFEIKSNIPHDVAIALSDPKKRFLYEMNTLIWAGEIINEQISKHINDATKRRYRLGVALLMEEVI